MKIKRILLATILSVLSGTQVSFAAESAATVAQEGLKAMKAKQYKEANKYFAKAAILNPRDASYQYYASLSAFQAGDKQTGKAALSRLFMTQTSHSPYMGCIKSGHFVKCGRPRIWTRNRNTMPQPFVQRPHG